MVVLGCNSLHRIKSAEPVKQSSKKQLQGSLPGIYLMSFMLSFS